MTRMRAVAESATGSNAAVVVMDTAPAAVLGATLDPLVAARERAIIVNVGNFHTLAFRIGRMGIEGLFEHHTGLIDREKLEKLLHALAEGTLQREDVYTDMGHGALVYDSSPWMLNEGDFDAVVTGPRRSIFQHSTTYSSVRSVRPYFPAPYGDMMITGCFGLLRATADVLPELADPIYASLFPEDKRGIAPWDLD